MGAKGAEQRHAGNGGGSRQSGSREGLQVSALGGSNDINELGLLPTPVERVRFNKALKRESTRFARVRALLDIGLNDEALAIKAQQVN